MPARRLFSRESDEDATDRDDSAPANGRSEVMQRLQVGVTGLFAVIMLGAVASAIVGRAQIAEDRAAPDAAPTTEPAAAAPQSDPLANAGAAAPVPVEPDANAKGANPDKRPAPNAAASETPAVPDIEPN